MSGPGDHAERSSTIDSAEGVPDDEAVPARPVLRIVRGDPTPEELAALTVVLAAASGGGSSAEEEDTGARSVWTERESLVRRPLTPGPGAWRASSLPR